jgi:hypothetical protein
MKKKSVLILFIVVLLFILNQIFLFLPAFFYSSLAIGALLIVLLTRNIVQPFRKHGWLIWIIAPILFWFAVSLYSTIIVGYFWIQILFLTIAWFIYSYFYNLYHYLPNKTPELNKKFDSIVLSGGVLICAASGASLYGLSSFISFPTILLLLFFLPIAFLLFAQFFPLRKDFWAENKFLLPVNVLILLELAFVLSFLPLNFNLLGFCLALGYYFLLTVMRLRWQGKLDRKNLKSLVILSVVIVFILFLSARWL